MRASALRSLQLATLAILDHSSNYNWRLQGFGLLKTYIRDLGRIHIWDSTLRYPDASLIHNHSWDLTSMVVAGMLVNQRYYVAPWGARDTKPYRTKRIVAGENPADASEEREVELYAYLPETYHPGEVYGQLGHEVHKTEAQDGTVTLVDRQHDGPEGQADVYWPAGTQWGNAAGREATWGEVNQAVGKALILLEKELRG